MRLLAIAAAALMVTGIAAAPASARPDHGRPGPGWHGGHRGGWHGGHRRCTWVWRHHHRVRRCW